MLGVHSGLGKTTLAVYICVLGVLSGQGKTTLTMHLCITRRLGVGSGRGKITLTLYFTSFKDYYVKTNQNFAHF